MQRLAVLEFLESTREHPTADEVFRATRMACPTIARATVYNTLDTLTRAGTISRLTIDRSASRYDADLSPHVHFRCRVCGDLLDLSVENPSDLVGRIDGHEIEAVRTYAYGVCASCLADDAAGTPDRTKETATESKAASETPRTDGKEARGA